jgi:hypothetical protein
LPFHFVFVAAFALAVAFLVVIPEGDLLLFPLSATQKLPS